MNESPPTVIRARVVAWSMLVASLVALRLYLAADRDILALNAPYDEYWYVSSALRLIWGGEYTHMAFAHLPVYSAWIAFLHAFGLPGRLAIDIAWLAASGYLAFALRHFTGSALVAAPVFVILAFHPFSFFIFDRALAETLLAVLSAFVLAGFIETWNCRERGTALRRSVAMLATTLGLAAAYHVRKEGILVVAPLAALAILSLTQRASWWSREGRRTLAYPLLVWPAAAVALAGLLLAGANAWRWGIAVRYELAAPGYVAAIEALNAIDPGKPTPKHVTITAATRARAYAASPTFAELRGFFEGPLGQSVARHAQQFTGVPGEIGNGWFYWALRDAGATAGWHRGNAPAADARYAAIADELNKAFTEGRLARRTVWSPFVDPDAGKWIPDLPRAASRAAHLLVSPLQAPLGGPAEDARTGQLADFVRALGRRRMPVRTVLAGWLKAPEGSAISLGDAGASYAWRVLSGPHRPDVPGGFPFRATSDIGESPTQVHVRLPDGSVHRLPLGFLKTGHLHQFESIPGAVIGIDELSAGTMKERLDPARLTALAHAWSWLGYVLGAVGIAGLALSRVGARRPQRPLVVLSGLLLFACFLRIALLAILDASSWNGIQARYLFPAVPLFVAFGALGATMLWRRPS